jgi:ABC-type nitrate/sulfonate/bicarbonate transport system substrate-binding protein
MNLTRDKASRVPKPAGRGLTPRRAARVGALALALAVAVALAGCGEIANTVTPKAYTVNNITVELSGPPSAEDVGLYAAQALGYFKQTDLNVVFQTPSTGQDPLTMVHAGQVFAAISSEPSVFLARNKEMPLVAIGALVRDPLSAIPITVPATNPPSGGKGIGGGTTTSTTKTKTTATATTAAATKTKKKKKKTATTTSTTTTSTTTTTTTGTTTGTTTSATTTAPTTTTPTPAQVPTGSAWPAQLQTLLAQASAPTYNGLVVVVRKGTIVDHAGVPRRLIQAIRRGYAAVRRNPKAGVADLIAADPGLATQKRDLLAAVRSLIPHFFPSGTIWGWQSEKNWNAFGTWLFNNKLIANPNAVTDASTNELLQGEGV